MIGAVADTHAVIWYLSSDNRLSSTAKTFINELIQQGHQIGISSITLIEMVYLIEKSRIPAGHFSQLGRELGDPGSMLVEVPVDIEIARTLTRIKSEQIPDMPDRIIAATALQLDVPIISRDSRIVLSDIDTVW